MNKRILITIFAIALIGTSLGSIGIAQLPVSNASIELEKTNKNK
jgi:hypothetical protein